jgi:hypothetical protein
MAIYHLNMKALQRSKGRSSVAAVAYQSGDKLHDKRQDMTFDYRRKERVLASKIIAPFGALKNEHREEIWNAVEVKHKHPRAVTARTIEIALPHELNDKQSEELAYNFASWLSKEYDVLVDIAIHDTGEKKNRHAHIAMSACSISKENGLGKKVEELDPIHCTRNGLPKPTDTIRPMWEKFCNEALHTHGIDNRIDHRTNAERGLGIPTVHQGFGINAEIKKVYNDEIKLHNKLDALDRTSENVQKVKAEHTEVEKTRPVAQAKSQPLPTTEVKKADKYSIQDLMITAKHLYTLAESGKPQEALAEWNSYYKQAVDYYQPSSKQILEKQVKHYIDDAQALTDAYKKSKSEHPDWFVRPSKPLPNQLSLFGRSEYEALKQQWANYNKQQEVTKKTIEQQKNLKRIYEQATDTQSVIAFTKSMLNTWIEKAGLKPAIDAIKYMATKHLKQQDHHKPDHSR